MTTQGLQIQPIMALPFAVQALPEATLLNGKLLELFEARAAGDAANRRGALCYVSPDDLLEQSDPAVTSTVASMLDTVRSVVRALNDFPDGTLESFRLQARGWFSLVRQFGSIPSRSYPMTAWCAAYCIEAPPPSPERFDSGVLRMHESRLGTMFADATTSAMHGPYALGHCTWRPKPGEMAVFPGSLTHEIALVRSPGTLALMMLRLRFVGPAQTGFERW